MWGVVVWPLLILVNSSRQAPHLSDSRAFKLSIALMRTASSGSTSAAALFCQSSPNFGQNLSGAAFRSSHRCDSPKPRPMTDASCNPTAGHHLLTSFVAGLLCICGQPFIFINPGVRQALVKEVWIDRSHRRRKRSWPSSAWPAALISASSPRFTKQTSPA